MTRRLQGALAEFDATDKTVRLVSAVMRVVPQSPEYHHVQSIKQLAQHLRIDPTPEVLNKVRAIADDERMTDALWMAAALDTGDKGYSVLTGASSAMKLFFGGKRRNLDFDKAQRNDAVLKALGLATIVHKVFPGSISDKVRQFSEAEAGQMLITWYGAMEIALPFADNLAQSGARFFDDLLDGGAARQLSRLASIAGGKAVEEARETLTELTGALVNGINRAQDKAPALAAQAHRWVPRIARGADLATGIAAQAVDLMPVYRLLGARLVGEAAIRRAIA